MKKGLLLAFVAALMITPAVSVAKGATGSVANPKVMYVLHGTLSSYTAYNAVTSTPGSITILVKSSNYHGRALKNTSLTFPVGANTKIVLNNGVTAIADNDSGIVKIKAVKKVAAADLAATLQAQTARQIIDNGPSS